MTIGLALALLLPCSSALAGPPYVTDDPEPTELGHWENYTFTGGTVTRNDTHGSGGLDLNFGAAPDLQLTAVIPIAWIAPAVGRATASLGNIELAAKYKVLHQDNFGLDVALFPRVFLPAASRAIGSQHFSLLLPIWVGRSWDSWSTFGGGGCTLNQGGGSRNFCQLGWTITNQITQTLQIGVEIYHQTADTIGERATTGLGFGAIYDVSERFHILASVGPGIQNAQTTNQASWYAAVLITL
jgi:hypothetical protein